MISRSFSLGEFFSAVDGMSYQETVTVAKTEPKAADSLSSRVKGAVIARQQGRDHYANVIRKYLFFLQYETKPGNIMDENFALFYSSCNRFVAEGFMKPGTL